MFCKCAISRCVSFKLKMSFRWSSTNFFRIYLTYFQLLGLCPVVFDHSKKLSSRLLIGISFLHIVLLTLVVIVAYAYGQYIFFIDGSLGQFNDTLLYIVILVACYATILESYVKRDIQSKIWSLLTQCHHNDQLDEIDQCKLWNCKEFNSYFIGLCALFESTKIFFF